jgi:hypothetical protein
MESVNRFAEWKQTRKGALISGVAEATLFYIFASLAIDSGSGWHYLLALIFLIGTIISFVKAVKGRAND